MTIKRRLSDFKTAMTVGELSEVLQVSQRHIYKLVQNEEIPFFRVGASVRFDPLVIDRWLNAEMKKHPGYLQDARKE